MAATLPIPRKKSCSQCSVSKLRCDLRRPSCSRCSRRGLTCKYAFEGPDGPPSAPKIPPFSAPNFDQGTASTMTFPDELLTAPTPSTASATPHPTMSSPASPLSIIQETQDIANFSQPIQLIPAVDVSHIRDRWLDFHLIPLKSPKNYSGDTIRMMSRILKSYPVRWVRTSSNIPPFIHPMQCHTTMPIALSNCLSLLRMSIERVPGSEKMIRGYLEQEMSRLIQEFDNCGQYEALAHLQAYLLLAIAIFFCLSNTTNAVPHEDFAHLFNGSVISHLQELASKVALSGLMCPFELDDHLANSEMSWEAWIIAEAKRRTIYTLYMVEGVWNFQNDSPSYISEELGVLPAPCSGRMWDARDRNKWRAEYNANLKLWKGFPKLQMAEFWTASDAHHPIDENQRTDVPTRSERIDIWAEDVDAFGMLVLATCTMTHGC